MQLSENTIVEAVKETLIQASTSFRSDQIQRYQEAAAKEKDKHARWVLETILENARVAEKERLPLCDDTGIPHVFFEIGDNVSLPSGFLAAVEKGIAAGLKHLPGRPMAVKGNDAQRISQSAGLFDDSAALISAPFQIRRIPGDKVRITVLMLGGGPEIRGRTLRVFHKHSVRVVLDEMIQWVAEEILKLGCLPCVPIFGIGRTNYEAASLAIEAMKEGEFTVQSTMEREITDTINKKGIGPLGLGGETSVLGTFIKVGPQRASGVRVVSLRLGCCFDPRRATIEL